MYHSIIIPNRGYDRYLRHCLWSLERSRQVCGLGRDELEVVVVHEDSRPPADWPDWVRVELVLREGGRPDPYFNKPRLLNQGIEKSQGDILTFLDADSIVGPAFLTAAPTILAAQDGPTKVCYRVRYLPQAALQQLDQAVEVAGGREGLVAGWTARWQSYPLAFEGYGERPETDLSKATEEDRKIVHGKAEFSIRREVLADLRFDEAYVGRGFEDLDMNRRIFRRYGPGYRGVLVEDAQRAMFQIRNPTQGEPWGPGRQNRLNMERYFADQGCR